MTLAADAVRAVVLVLGLAGVFLVVRGELAGRGLIGCALWRRRERRAWGRDWNRSA